MKHILLMDDETSIVQLLTRLLQRSDYKVTVALDGKEGMELYRNDPADLVIVDIFMPEMDGLEVIRQLKAEFPDVHLIAISGAPKNLLHEAKELGANQILRKPFNLDVLLQAIETELGFAD